MARARWAVSLLVMSLGICSCAHDKIRGTNIDDTDENREILSVVEEYHRAVENLDADAVLALVSPKYFEDNGNTTEADDYDYKGLSEGLRANFGKTRALQLEIRVDAIEVDEDVAWAELYYRIRAQNEYPSGLKWETDSDRTRLRFVRTGDVWKIIDGI